MTIPNLLKQISSADKKSAKASINHIREFEELGKGVFVAFIDEGADSWDLRLTLTPKTGKIKELSCDCKSRKKICLHKIAFLTYLKEGHTSNSTLARKIVSNKKTKADKLMSSVGDDDKILDWIRDKLNEDKILRLAFEKDLIDAVSKMDTKILQRQYQSAYKTIIGRKKYAAAGELPQMLKLFKKDYEQALTTIFNQPNDPKATPLCHTLLEISHTLKYLPKRATTRTATFVKNCLKNTLPSIPSNPDHIWSLCQLLAQAAPADLNQTDLLHPVLSTYGQLLSPTQLIKILKTRIGPIMKYMTEEKIPISYITLSQNLGVFSDLADSFKLVSYQNKYNATLLSALMDAKCYDRVTTECEKSIGQNTPKYQGMYFEFLTKVAVIQKDERKLFKIIMLKLNSIPLFQDYLQLYELKLTKDEKTALKKYSEKLVLSSNYGAYYEYIQMKFLYWHKEKSYNSILDKIKDKPTLAYSRIYWDQLWTIDPELFIRRVGLVFKYKPFFSSDNLQDTAAQYIKAKLLDVSDEKIKTFTPATRNCLAILDIQC